MKNGRNYRDSLVNIFSVEKTSQESHGFNHERFNKEVNYLAVDINNDEHDCGWMTLKELNKHSYYED